MLVASKTLHNAPLILFFNAIKVLRSPIPVVSDPQPVSETKALVEKLTNNEKKRTKLLIITYIFVNAV